MQSEKQNIVERLREELLTHPLTFGDDRRRAQLMSDSADEITTLRAQLSTARAEMRERCAKAIEALASDTAIMLESFDDITDEARARLDRHAAGYPLIAAILRALPDEEITDAAE